MPASDRNPASLETILRAESGARRRLAAALAEASRLEREAERHAEALIRTAELEGAAQGRRELLAALQDVEREVSAMHANVEAEIESFHRVADGLLAAAADLVVQTVLEPSHAG